MERENINNKKDTISLNKIGRVYRDFIDQGGDLGIDQFEYLLFMLPHSALRRLKPEEIAELVMLTYELHLGLEPWLQRNNHPSKRYLNIAEAWRLLLDAIWRRLGR